MEWKIKLEKWASVHCGILGTVLCVPLSVSTYFKVLNSLLTKSSVQDWVDFQESCIYSLRIEVVHEKTPVGPTHSCLPHLIPLSLTNVLCASAQTLLNPTAALNLTSCSLNFNSCSCQDSSRYLNEYVDKTYVVLTNDSNHSVNRNNNRCQELTQTLSHTQYYG